MRTHLPEPDWLRLALSTDSDLVTHGLVAMLALYDGCVQLVLTGTLADVTLVDLIVTDLELWLGRHDHGWLLFYVWDVTPALVLQAQDHGIGGCVSKHLVADCLVVAIEQVYCGHVVVESGRPTETATSTPMSFLTFREVSVIWLITNGLSNEDVALHLNLSINSVKSYIRSTYCKIGVGSRAQVVVWGVRNGFLSELEDAGLGHAS